MMVSTSPNMTRRRVPRNGAGEVETIMVEGGEAP